MPMLKKSKYIIRNLALKLNIIREKILLRSLIRIIRLNGYYPFINNVAAQLYTG